MADSTPPKDYDEADSLRRWSRGDEMSARDGGSNAKASVEGGFWIALIALALAFIALGVAWWSSLSATMSAAQAERAALAATLGREYIVTTYAEIQRELAKHDMTIEGPMGHHEPVPDEYYVQWDGYVEERTK